VSARPEGTPEGQAGFTLVELVVGMAIGGIVLLAGFAALATLQDRSQHALAATTHALEGATARATLIEWISTARLQSSSLGMRFEGLDSRELGLPWDELTFPTPARTPLRAPVTVVRLYVDDDPMTPERGLVAEMTDRVEAEPIRMELLSQVTGMLIRYLPVADVPVEWTEGWSGQSQLPRALEITLFDDPADPLPPLLRFPIRVALATLQ
jgi:prepilin-type N-terminal cleavage/methylation domain-containing protein